MTTETRKTSLISLVREWPLLLSWATAAVFLAVGQSLPGDLSGAPWFAFILIWLLAAILVAAFAVVRHAESLAVKLGEPLGTLVLTLSVLSIEVTMIAATMTTGTGNPSLARDAMFAVVMIVLNGLVGLSLLLGGLRHHEQTYNLKGANAFLAMILPLAVLGLILPNFTTASPGPTFSRLQALMLILMSVGLYGIFLALQTSRHRHYFVAPRHQPGDRAAEVHRADLAVRSAPYHAVLLVLYLLPLVVLAKQFAVPLDYGIRVLHAPHALGGFVVAALVLSPESLGAVRAALANQLQRAVNILLGSVVATIALTIPAVLAIGLVTGRPVVLGLGPAEMILLALTLVLSVLTFTSSRTNVLLGLVHLLLFGIYLMLIFD